MFNKLFTAVQESVKKGECGCTSLRVLDIVKTVKFRGLLTNGDLPYAYLGSNIIDIPEELISTASLIKGKSEENLFVIYSTHYINV
jgi:hypothetical protein